MTQKPTLIRMLRGPAVSLVIAAVLIAGTLYAAQALLTRGQAAAQAEDAERVFTPLTVLAQRVRLENSYTEERRFTGLVAARRASDLGFEIGGIVTSVNAQEGDRIAEGDVVATLGTERLNAELQRLRASLAEARAAMKLAELTYARQVELNRQGHTSDQAVDEADAGRDQTRAQVSAIEAQIAALNVDISDASLRAPFSGTITRRLLDEGAVVSAGQPVLRLLETEVMEARIGVPPGLAGTLSTGQPLSLLWRGTPITGTVDAILPSVGLGSRTVTVIALLEDEFTGADGELIDLVMEDEHASDGFWVPNDALVEGLRGLWSIYLLEPEQDAESGGSDDPLYRTLRASVEVLYTDGQRSYVAGTAGPGALILWSGAHRVAPGQIVLADERGAGS